MMADRGGHGPFVHAWFERSGDPSPHHALRQLEAALFVIWDRTGTMFGEVTLSAIADRVLWNAVERFPALAGLTVDPKRGIVCAPVLERIEHADAAEIHGGARYVLAEMLTVLGNLTDEILTEQLRAELIKIQPRRAPREDGGPSGTGTESSSA